MLNLGEFVQNPNSGPMFTGCLRGGDITHFPLDSMYVEIQYTSQKLDKTQTTNCNLLYTVLMQLESQISFGFKIFINASKSLPST